jgi:hypothetical protein
LDDLPYQETDSRVRQELQSFFLEKKRNRKELGPVSEKFISEMSLSHFTSEFLYYIVRESLQLLKKNYASNDF